MIEYAIATGPIAGPFSGDIRLAHASMQTFPAGVQVTNFHTEVQFTTPIGAPPGVWSIGFCFWVDFEGNCYDAFIRSDGASAEWVYGRSDASGAIERLQSGPISGLDLTPGASNFIGLTVVNGTGIFIVNSPDPAVSFALESASGVGDVVRFASFESADETDTTSFVISTQGFWVWDLSGLPALETVPTAEPEPTEETVPTAEITIDEATAVAPTAEATTDEPTEEPDPVTETTASEDDVEAFGDLKAQALLQAPLAGPYADSMPQSALSANYASAIFTLTDVYATATFVNPEDTSVPWDLVLGIRAIGDNTEPLFVLLSNGEWYAAFGNNEPVLSGLAPEIDTLPLGVNTIEFAAQGNNGYVAVNGTVVTQIDLSGVNRPGDVFVGTGFFAANIVEGRPVGYQDFLVWEIPASDNAETAASPFDIALGEQVAGPYAGSLSESTDAIELSEPAVDIADFYTSVVFAVPEDDSAPWDFTIAFRHTGGNDQYRLTIVSDGTWLFALGNESPISTGSVTNLATTPGQENRIDLFVQGDEGGVALNGLEFTTIDVSESASSGDIWIATAGNTENTVAGRTTPYRDFEVWSLE
ncbi:hypothetical protein BH24CHL4_BH24CHL4_17690 [soil metagenome]